MMGGDVIIKQISEVGEKKRVLDFHVPPPYVLTVYCSTSQRGVAWVLLRNGKRGRMHQHLSERTALSTPTMALVLNP